MSFKDSFSGRLGNQLMPLSDCEIRDPRMKRTRQLLQSALHSLLQQKTFDEILVQDIAEAATVNRATFYDHYTDKFALFDAMIAGDFHKFLEVRGIRFNGGCSSSALAGMILALCEYLKRLQGNYGCAQHTSSTALIDAAITLTIRRIVLDGLSEETGKLKSSREIVASAVSGAIFGAAKEWVQSADRRPVEEILPSLVLLVLPLLEGSDRSHAVPSPTKRRTKMRQR
jgi:AcrR family transcriptional regulator